MRQFVLILIAVLFGGSVAIAQTVLQGTVRYAGSKEPVAGANVIFQSPDGARTLGYTIADADGKWSFGYKGSTDTIRIMVTGFNLKASFRTMPVSIGSVDFLVEYEELQIKEVTVKAEPIKRHGDTLNYYVSAYIDTLVDRSIGDVLKKMPGIDVAKNGQIYYNNRPINKFYIEDMDLMGGRYGVAVNNVRAEDVASVEVMENHQPVKVLAGFEFSPDAAINLRLKRSAKGSLIATFLLGTGYTPWVWTGEMAMMYFTGKWQMMSTYKTNNAGRDVASELTSFYDALSQERSLLSVHKPATPDTDRERYMDNVTHAATISQILKLGKHTDATINLNAMYLHDRQRFNASSLTTFYLPDQQALEIDETTSATFVSDNVEISSKYNLNAQEIYLDEQIACSFQWDNDFGSVINGPNRVDQSFGMHQLRLQNDLRFTRLLHGDFRLNFVSQVRASEYPSSMRVNPLLYPEIFGYDAQEGVQDMSNRKLFTTNTLYLSKSFSRVGIDLHASTGFTADLQEMASSLFDPIQNKFDNSLCNNMGYSNINIHSNIGMTYRYKSFRLTAGVGPNYSFVSVDDRIQRNIKRKNKLFFNPRLNIDLELTPNLSFVATSSFQGNLGAASSIYSGYIMTDYRVISCRKGDIAESKYLSGNAELRYADALRSVFASLKVSGWRSWSNLMFGTTYSGSLSRIESYNIDNIAQGWGIEGKIEKRFDALSTTVGLPVSFRMSHRDILRQDALMKTSTGNFTTGMEVNARLAPSVFLDYGLRYTRSRSIIVEQISDLLPINALQQHLSFSFIAFKRMTINLNGEHYYNNALPLDNRSMFFLDASIKYKTKKFEYLLEGRNLLNINAYNHRSCTDITDRQYSYLLRPASVMFSVRFAIGA